VPLPTPQPTPVPAGVGLLVWGVALPLVTLLVEGTTHICAEMLFDPLPTPAHVVLVALVAGSNAACWRQLSRPTVRAWKWVTFLNGMALAVATIYSVMFVPILPLAFLALLFVVGVLPLSPLLALGAAVVARKRLHRLIPALGPPVALWKGLVVGAVVTVAADAPVGLTRLAMAHAADANATHRPEAFKLLRFMGDEETMRAACYGGRGKASLLGLFSSAFGNVGSDHARQTYFQVTGRQFNRADRPDERGWEGKQDVDLAGDLVGGMVPGLTLAASRLQGSVDGDAALAYLEWTLRFEADPTVRQAEARMQVQLPPGAVVSRVTLMVNGKEEEAAYAPTAQVKAAYQAVVQQRRDPVLVTWRGPDRVAVQAFPITPQQPLTLKLGITMPLYFVDTVGEGLLRFPQLVDHNFAIQDPVLEAIALESGRLMKGVATLKTLERSGGVHRVAGALTQEQLRNAVLRVDRKDAPARAFTPLEPSGNTVVTQVVSLVPARTPARVVVVLDGSHGMAPHRAAVAQALQQLPAAVEVAVVAALDTVTVLAGPAVLDVAQRQALAAMVRNLDTVGGRDNVPALVHAGKLAASSGETLVVWVHGNQPVLWAPGEALRDWTAHNVTLLDVAVRPGANAVVDHIGAGARVRALPRVSTLQEDLRQEFQRWSAPHPAAQRAVASREGVDVSQAKATSAHLARLYVAEQVLQLAQAGSVGEASALAVQHRLVTPVSGAVVLERQEQYAAAGLTQADAGSVPTVPEASLGLMVLLALVVLHLARLGRAG